MFTRETQIVTLSQTLPRSMRYPAITNTGLLFALFVLISGCGETKHSIADQMNDNIKKVRGAYGIYLIAHNMQGPKNEEEFKEYLTTNRNAIVKLERMGVTEDEILDIFVSERDGQAFKIRYGWVGLGDHPMVFESEGVDGKRMVAYLPPRELDAVEYEKAWNLKITKKATMQAPPDFGSGS